jgi:hypothetical protein
MSKCTLSSLNILNNKFKNKTRDFWKKLRNLWYIFFPTPKNSFLPFQIWRYIIAYTWICYISGGLTVNGLPSKNTMMIFLVSSIAYIPSVRLKKILIYLFFLISLFFLLVYYTWQKLFSAPFGLYWFIVAFSPLCVMPLRTHGKDSRVKK